MAKQNVRLCDRCLPIKTLAVGTPFPVQIGGFKLTYDLCAPHKAEMKSNVKLAIAALKAKAKAKPRRKKVKKVAAKKRKRVAAHKVRKIAATLVCRYGCGKTFRGPTAARKRGQHERQDHGGAFKEQVAQAA
jgi:hypothetical protein